MMQLRRRLTCSQAKCGDDCWFRFSGVVPRRSEGGEEKHRYSFVAFAPLAGNSLDGNSTRCSHLRSFALCCIILRLCGCLRLVSSDCPTSASPPCSTPSPAPVRRRRRIIHFAPLIRTS